ncbi:MAG: ABC transporter substrate-binding protein [Oscillospiraceae bacterium]|nr:ABC transporter substrate-binding protein [Oscillospiraceae bacterium]
MKKFAAMLLAMTMVLALCACSNKGADGTQPAQGGNQFTTVEEGKLHMATNAKFPPYEMVTDDGGFEGIDVEVATEIAKKLGLELVVDDQAFTAALTAAANGQSDIVMAGVTVNDERKETLAFTDTYATGVQVVIVKEGSDVTMDNLGEKMIGCQKGTTGYIYASDTPENGGYGEDHVIGYDNGAMAVEALKGGQIDCVIIDNEPAKAFVAANEGLTLLEGNWVLEDYAIGVKKDNTALLDAVNGALKELIADGTVQKIVDKYIPAE